MKSSPDIISKQLPYCRLLQSFNISVSDVLPTTFSCLLCKTGNMHVCRSPEGSEWYWCNSCKFYGEALSLVRKKLNLDCNYLTVKKLMEPPYEFFSPNFPETYIDQYNAKEFIRTKLLDFWTLAKYNLETRNAPSSRAILNKLGLLSNVHKTDGPEVKFKALLGFVTRHELNQFLETIAHKYITKNSKRVNADCLILPIWDVPGKIGAFVLCSFYKSELAWDTITFNKDNEDRLGFSFLETIQNPHDTIIACTDIQAGLLLQKKYLFSNGTFGPIIITPGKEVYWESILASNIIVWDPNTNFRMYTQSKQLGDRGLVVPKNSLGNNPISIITNIQAKAAIALLTEKSKSWTYALKEHILKLNPGELSELLININLTKEDKLRILDACETTSQKELVNNKIGYITSSKTVETSAGIFVEKNGSLYHINKKGQDVLVTDCNVCIEDVITEVNANNETELYYSGNITFRGKFINFYDKAINIQKDAATWLQKTVVIGGKGIGFPFIDSKFKKTFFDVFIRMHEPKVTETVDQLGWDTKNRRLILPNCIIHNGEAIKATNSIKINKDIPFDNIIPENLNNIDSTILTENNGANVFGVALLAVLTYHFLGSTHNAVKLNIAYRASKPNVTRFIRSIKRHLNLPLISVQVKSHLNLHRFTSLKDATFAPVIMEYSDSLTFNKWLLTYANSGGVIAAVSDEAYFLINNLSNWMCLDIDDINLLSIIDFKMADVFTKYMIYLSSLDFRFPDGINFLDSIFYSITGWLKTHNVGEDYNYKVEALISSAKKCISINGITNNRNEFTNLLEYYKSINKLNEVDRINLGELVTIINQSNYPILTLQDLENSLLNNCPDAQKLDTNIYKLK